RPRVELLVTGNELLPCGSRPEGYRIVDSNSVMLGALVERDGGVALPAFLLPDTPDPLRRALRASGADVILVTGGSSVATEDGAAEALARVGELGIEGVAVRPGAPLGVGFVDHRPVFLLPGNPVSCLCAYDLFAGHAVRRLGGGLSDLPYPRKKLPLGQQVQS